VSEYNGFSFHQRKRIKDPLEIFDSPSTHRIFYEEDIVTEIRESTNSITMLPIGRWIVYNKIADCPEYGAVWFNSSGIANVVTMAEAESRGHLISDVSNCCKVAYSTTLCTTAFSGTTKSLFAHNLPIQRIALVRTVNHECL
jgi:hypothetical protein